MFAEVSRRPGERPLGTRIERDEGVGARLEFEGNYCAPISKLEQATLFPRRHRPHHVVLGNTRVHELHSVRCNGGRVSSQAGVSTS